MSEDSPDIQSGDSDQENENQEGKQEENLDSP